MISAGLVDDAIPGGAKITAVFLAMVLMIVNRPLPCAAQSCEATLLTDLILPIVETEPFPMYGIDCPCFDLSGRSL